jgi:hypothetical protein
MVGGQFLCSSVGNQELFAGIWKNLVSFSLCQEIHGHQRLTALLAGLVFAFGLFLVCLADTTSQFCLVFYLNLIYCIKT